MLVDAARDAKSSPVVFGFFTMQRIATRSKTFGAVASLPYA